MLISLDINNIAIIDSLRFEPKEGLNVLTGETGAGKSIIIDCINLILGCRASKELIRHGEKKARIQALFSVPDGWAERVSEYGIELDSDQMIIDREISADGRSVCRINGVMVPQNIQREIAAGLVNIHGQQDSQALLDSRYHIGFLDSYARNEAELAEYKSVYGELCAFDSRIKRLTENEKDRQERVDLLSYQTEELFEAALKVGEKEELKTKRELIRSSERIAEATSAGYSLLYDDEQANAYELLSQATGELGAISDLTPELSEIHSRLMDLKYAAEELAHEVRAYRDGCEYDEEELNEIEERLDIIGRMEKKYGGSVEAALEYEKKAQAELDELNISDAELEELAKKRDVLYKTVRESSDKLSGTRQKAAQKLAKDIETALSELDMPKVKFEVCVKQTSDLRENGVDEVEFLFSPNKGEPVRALTKIASGGELSRVMLALKSIITDGVDTLIFDEIDTGVSGAAAGKIADKLRTLGKKSQVICITHQAVIAAAADTHMLIKKSESSGRTVTGITELDSDGREREIARITDGENLSEAAIAHAREMLRAQGGRG